MVYQGKKFWGTYIWVEQSLTETKEENTCEWYLENIVFFRTIAVAGQFIPVPAICVHERETGRPLSNQKVQRPSQFSLPMSVCPGEEQI